MRAVRIHIIGTVQGVGFRPFVFRIANEEGLKGFVRNTPDGVEIHIEGVDGFDGFISKLKRAHPPNARIDKIDVVEVQPLGLKDFTIETTREGGATVFAPPDLFTCNDCQRELLDPSDRRFKYPFINCTNCGPRYTIIHGLPYDREKTTMRIFKMCPECEKEYSDPLNRRFHAEPNACPECGPSIFFIENGHRMRGGLERAVETIREGKVLALKGLGGFHLVCDPFNKDAVMRLRRLKDRERKPFALMAKDIEMVKEIAFISPDEERILESASRPIVLLKKRKEIWGISPGLDTYGIMLPYTPLHYLILQEFPLIIATSANLRESPIMKDESEGVEEISDSILTHNREIAVRCDDSVVKVFRGKPLFLRRGRGYVPDPIILPISEKKSGIIGLGGELKNTITILKNNYAITSQYLGDMKDYRNLKYLEEIINHFKKLYDFEPEVYVCDLHPDFTTSRLAERSGKRILRLQHHIAHVFAVLAEHSVLPDSPILGVSWDGMGYGEDGKIWGGEFFLIKGPKVLRRIHFDYIPQPGGDLAVKEPWRMALSFILRAHGRIVKKGILEMVDNKKLESVKKAVERGVNAPLTSSVGRLFDAVSAIAGISPLKIDYEAEPAMKLEAVYEEANEVYTYEINEDRIEVNGMIKELVEGNEPPSVISGRFHFTLAKIILDVANFIRRNYNVKKVVLSGGVFLNRVLLELAVPLLENNGFEVLYPMRFSPGDEAISLGQVFYASLYGG